MKSLNSDTWNEHNKYKIYENNHLYFYFRFSNIRYIVNKIRVVYPDFKTDVGAAIT